MLAEAGGKQPVLRMVNYRLFEWNSHKTSLLFEWNSHKTSLIKILNK